MDNLDLGATIRGFTAGQRIFGRYTLKKILGRGGMGVVWLARDESLERDLAIKMLPELVATDPAAVRDLKRETSRCQQLSHPHILRIYDFSEGAGLCGITMELVDGGTLTALRLDQPGEIFTVEQLRPWVQQLCEALEYAHARAKVVHRDLKPANLMVTAGGELKVADFGIARSVSDSVSRVSNQAGTSGTPVYMSPQQMMGDPASVTDDVYALGATLYELLTGRPPFYTGNVVTQVQNKVPPSMTERRKELQVTGEALPPEWERTIAACLAKEAGDRPRSVAEVAHLLGLADAPPAPRVKPPRADLDAGHTLRGLPSASAQNAPTVRKSRTGLYAGLIASVLLLAGVGYYFGIQVPAQKRRADEQAQLQAEQARQAQERERQRQAEAEAAAKAATEAKAKAEREQDDYTAIMAQIAAVHDDAPRAELEAMERVVQEYLQKAPDRFKAGAQQALARRRDAWVAYEAAHRAGSLAIETEPAGATVTLYPRNERKTSPAVFKDIKPGEISFRVEQEGYEAQDFTYVIKPGTEHRAERVRLLSTTGSVAVTSQPTGAKVALDGNSRHFEGVTPFKQSSIPPGEYRVTYQRADWRPVVKAVTVRRSEEAALTADLRGVGLTIRSTPTGAQVTLNGKAAGQTPLSLTDQAPGEYRVTVTHEGYDATERTVAAESNTTVEVPLAKSVAQVGTLVLYRESHFTGGGSSPDIKIDGQLVGELGNGTWFAIELPIGEHEIGLKSWGISEVGSQVQVQTGKTAYIAVAPMTSGFSGTWGMRPTSEGTAKSIISKLRPAKHFTAAEAARQQPEEKPRAVFSR
ncbi:MAG: PEGA domain-containing protein [Lacunisphaera sp.]|nr:PEGA domain-containing protein [Lacunisphaera sp.]